ncbi:MAG: hypothetical protein ABIN91_21985 [Mucilaginibacter sp.]|uniref:hypothetical protein n=1 Tax=Mucilaginibacter sp. TaxID=1882438 RepID=UPI003266369B
MKKTYYSVYILLFALVLFLTNCKKSTQSGEVTPTIPSTTTGGAIATLTTSTLTSVTTTTAMAGGVVVDRGGSSVTDRGVCWALTPTPTIGNYKAGTSSVSGSGAFTSSITGLTASTTYYVRAYATNKGGTSYGNEMIFNTADILSATFTIPPMFIIGSALAAVDVQVVADGGSAITERGICWGLNANPLITDKKAKHSSIGIGKFRGLLSGLTERTSYHLRAYAINGKGVSYSSDVTFKTIGKGNVTYTINKSAAPTADETAAYARMQFAADSAVWYLNNYTSATKQVTLNYVPGVATADATNQGWIRYGSDPTYQKLRTTLHEMNHTLGTGTTTWWTGIIVGGKHQGQNTNTILNQIQNSTGAQLSGDSQHWWPYGLNQDSEVTSSWDYVYNCLIIEAMRKDGLPTATSGPYIP